VSEKEARLLEGKVIAQAIQQEIAKTVEDYRLKRMKVPCLVALQARQDPASDWYLDQQEKLAKKLGILFEKFPPRDLPSQKLLEEKIQQVSRDDNVHGLFLAMPLPSGFDAEEALLDLDPRKDVEGIHPASLGLLVRRRAKLIPPTAYAALRLIDSTGVELRGKRATLVGQSAIVGRPLQLLLGARRVMTIVCNTGTSQSDMESAVSQSDLVVACAGKPGLVKGEWIKRGAIVIDVGTTEVNGKLVGDVEFEEAKTRADFITPVPGGVGPLTVTMLMQNLIAAYRWQQGL